MMRLVVPDLVSNSYFPAIAAVELGYLCDAGFDVDLELMFPVTEAARALRDGEIDFLAGAAHAPFHVDPQWQEIRLLAALARNTYWFLVVRNDLVVDRTTLPTLRDVRIGAAPGPDLGLHHLLRVEGVDAKAAGITVAPVPGTDRSQVSFGVTAAQALQDGRIDAFWANGMGAEVAVRSGAGKIAVDARRDGGPSASFTFPALMASQRTIHDHPDATAAAVRAIARAHRELRRAPELAGQVGRALFPPMEAELIASLIERDLDFYQHTIPEEAVTGLVAFAQACDLTDADLGYNQLVSATGRAAW